MKIGSHWAMPPFDLKFEQVLAPAVLEDRDDDAVGRAHREQVEHDRLRRDHERPERDEQQANAKSRTNPKTSGAACFIVWFSS